MTIHDQIRDEKLPCDKNIKAAQISVLPSGKVYKCKYVTGEEILPSNQKQVIEQTKFTYSPLGKAFQKQIKTIEKKEKKEVDILKNFKRK